MIRVLLVDDHMILREGIRIVLANQMDIEVVAEADNGNSALELAGEHFPDVVLMDINLPGLNGIETTRRISSKYPLCKVLILSAHSDQSLLLQALSAGARGYILKSSVTVKELMKAIQTVATDKNYFSESVNESIIEDYLNMRLKMSPTCSSLITLREQEILQLYAEGKNTKEIAYDLNLSPKTVDTHRQRIMKKLNLCNIAELVRYAIREGLTTIVDQSIRC
jgi:DNA-binding NarL/FixJ family response regulator